MSTNGNGQFLESELIHRKVKVGNDWQTRTFPVVGGRLRLAHEQNDSLSLQTEMVNWDGEYVTTEIPLILFHQVDNKPDSTLDESCDFWKSFFMVLRSRISTRQKLVWDNPIRPTKRDTRKACHRYLKSRDLG